MLLCEYDKGIPERERLVLCETSLTKKQKVSLTGIFNGISMHGHTLEVHIILAQHAPGRGMRGGIELDGQKRGTEKGLRIVKGL